MEALLTQLSEKQLLYILERLRMEYFQAEITDIPSIKEKKRNIGFDGIRNMLLLLGQVSDIYANKIKALALESQNPRLLNQVVTMGVFGNLVRVTSIVLIHHLISPLIRARNALAKGISPLERDNVLQLLKNVDEETKAEVYEVIAAWNEEEREKYIFKEDKTPFAALILTPKDVEFQAVVSKLKNITDVFHQETTTYYKTGYFGEHRIAVRETGAGNYVVSAEAERAINFFRPQIALLVGMVGGVSKKKVKIGDIIIGNRSYYYESGVETKVGFLNRQRGDTYDHKLVELSRYIKNQNPVNWTRFTKHGQAYNAKIGTIAAGEKVIESTEDKAKVYDLIQANCQDALAVEMEAVGFSYALSARRDKVKGINIRSVSDMLDGKAAANAKGSKELASENAAAFAFELLSQLKMKAS